MSTLNIRSQELFAPLVSESSPAPKKISMNAAMNKFYSAKTKNLESDLADDYKNAMLVLQIYFDSFGEVLLRAANATPTFDKTSNRSTCTSYEPAALAGLFRSAVIFFLDHKVNAPLEVKRKWLEIFEEYIQWLKDKRYLSKGLVLNLTNIQKSDMDRAAHVARLIANSISREARSNTNLEEVHNVEPLYVVSRVGSGKLSFIHCSEMGYDEFGPVSVPLGASAIVRPGWLIDGAFGKFKGRWKITSIRQIVPV